ncbi:SDR family oxidoreductase [Nocardia sp. CA-128927]|uniref:SDR family oxidoreductase n=1 Tax=Nocardia sp. CA-128927 TaxID=3239975 RepID=UPI003D9722F0
MTDAQLGSLEGKVALVTGGGRGVGAAISKELARRGAHVIVNWFHSKDSAEQTIADICADGGLASGLRATVAKLESVAEMFVEIGRRHGGLDILVNNAACGVFAAPEDVSEQEWQRALDVNVHGARWCAIHAAPLMTKRGGGAIVNLSSIGAGMAVDNYMVVGVCKAAVEALTRYLAADLGRHNIRVNTASAGFLDGPTTQLFPDADTLRATCAAAAPLGRVGKVEELAKLVAFLASPDASWVCGQSYLADGGLSVGRAMLTPTPGMPRPQTCELIANPDDYGCDAVAIVGVGVVVPGARTAKEFWELLGRGESVFTEPGDRFDVEAFWSPGNVQPDRTYSRVAGYIDESTGPSADYVTTWLGDTLLQCDQNRLTRHAESQIACFLGAWNEGSQHVEESLVVEAATAGIAAHWPGRADPDTIAQIRAALRGHYRHAGDVSRHLPYRAARAAVDAMFSATTPLTLVDTACSSSLYAIDLGIRAVLDGECDVAFCGGVFALGPRLGILFSQLHGLSETGRVLAFDDKADGVLFSDGAGMVALKRLDRARRDGDQVLAVLAGCGAASDGQGKAVHAPSTAGQVRAVARAHGVNGINADQIDWIVAHATGTPVGDAVERESIAQMAPDIGWECTSNKSIIGHTGWSAGVVSVIHAILAMQHDMIPAQAPLTASPSSTPGIHIPDRPVPFPPRSDRPRTVGVSAFGFGGTNAHILVQEPSAQAAQLRSAPPQLTTDTDIVIVGWHAHVPGGLTQSQIALRITSGQSPSPERTFGDPYPLPPVSEVRMPPRTAQAIDPTHLMALQAASALATADGSEFWQGHEDRTGVFAAYTGLPGSSADLTVRCYKESLQQAINASDVFGSELREAAQAYLRAVDDRCSPAGEDTLPGVMPNVLAARIAGVYDLHGPTMAVDSGPTSGREALRAASAYLRRGDIDLAAVVGVGGRADPLYEETHGIDPGVAHEGAIILVLTRAAVANEHRWPVLATLPQCLQALPDRNTIGPFLAADDLIDAIRVCELNRVAHAPEITRHVPRWRAAGVTRAGHVQTGALIVTDPRCSTATRKIDDDDVTHIYTVTVTPGQAAEEALAPIISSGRVFRHLRIVLSLHEATQWPARPTQELLALQETVFLAIKTARDGLTQLGTLGIALLSPFSNEAPHPQCGLFTGFVKSLAWELDGCTTAALITDLQDPATALAALEGELADPDTFPVTLHREGRRFVQRLSADRSDLGSFPILPDAVVVATGGARGITAACMLGLAAEAKVRLWLLGSSDVTDAPAHLLEAADEELPTLRAQYIAEQLQQSPTSLVRDINTQFNRLLRARESQLNLHKLRKLCGDANLHFRTCDVTDYDAVACVADEIRRTEGRVDLLVHGAGLHHPGEIGSLDLSALRYVRGVKLDGYHNLRDTFNGAIRPSLWCNFGSMASVIGLPGESAYAAANDFLACASGAAGYSAGEYTIGWTLWGETGLGAGEIAESYAARTARLTRTTTREGVAHFLDELRRQPGEPLCGFIGKAEHSALDQRFPGFVEQVGAPELLLTPTLRTVRPTSVHGLLAEPAEQTADSAQWLLTLDLGRQNYIQHHLIDGKPTVPGAMLVAIAAEAARKLAPDLPLREIRNVAFNAFVRMHTSRHPTALRITAYRRINHTLGRQAVFVVGSTDIFAPDGSILVRNRRNFHAVVILGGPCSLPEPIPLTTNMDWQTVLDPHYQSDSPVQLTGPFAATVGYGCTPEAATAIWMAPFPEAMPEMAIPTILLDSLIRTRALRPEADGNHAVIVPRSFDRIVIEDATTDTAIARMYPEGVRLIHSFSTEISSALTADEKVIMQVCGLRGTVAGYVKSREIYPALAAVSE